MNIANAGGTLTPMPKPIAPADGTVRATLGPDADCVDPIGPTDGAPTDAPFAQLLTQRISGDDAADDANGRVPTVPAATLAATDTTQVEDPPNAAKADASADASGNASDDAISTDLAAQLALASQWGGVAPQVPAPAPPPPVAASALDALAIDGSPAATRGIASNGDAAVGPATAAIDARALDATGTDSRRGIAIANRAGDVKSTNESAARARGDAARGVEAPTVIAQPATSPLPSDSSAFNPLANLTVGLAAAASTPTPTPASTPALPDALRQMVGTPAWSREVGSAMVRMAVDDLQSAALRLNPEHLGPLDVQVRVDNGVAHLAFQAAHADTRHAIEASRPMLEHLFAEQGLKIGDCAVGDSASRDGRFDADRFNDASQANTSSRHPSASRLAIDGEADASAPAITMRVARALGMVDTFA